MNPSTTRPERHRSTISRRSVVVGTAWAVPAVVVASAAPALAASGVTVGIGGICVGPGNTLRIRLTISNPTGVTGTLTISSLTIDNAVFNTGLIPTITISAAASSTAVISVPNPGFSAGTSVAIALGFSALVAGSTTTGTANATLTIASNGQCPF